MKSAITKKKLKEDTVQLSQLMEDSQWDQAATFAAANPHVLTQRMCKTPNKYNLYIGEPFLNRAAESGTLECVTAMVDAGAPLEGRCTQKGRTALLASLAHAAGGRSRTEIADYLIEKGARADAIDDFGESVIYQSCGDLPIHLTKKFIEAGTPLNTWHRNEHDMAERMAPSVTTLAYRCWTARSEDRYESLREIIRSGVNLNPPLQSINDHPLAAALQLPDMSLATMMVEYGANPLVEGPDGKSLLFTVGSEEAVQWLLTKNAAMLDAPDNRGRRPLAQHLKIAGDPAYLAGSTSGAVARALMIAGADIDAYDDQGPGLSTTPRQLIADRDIPEVKNFLRSWLAAQAASEALDEIALSMPSP